MLVVKAEYYDATSAACGLDGVLTVAKPVDRDFFWSALTLARAMHARTRMIYDENAQLRKKIEEIRLVDRAKSRLISQLSMNEQDAHRFIEKQAMDKRVSKRVIAEGILRIYE